MDKKNTLKTVKKYIEFLKESGLNIQNVFLFGSYARGNFNDDSDIDLAIIFKDLQDSFKMQIHLMKLRRKFDTRIEPHPFDENDFDPSHPFANEILKTGIQLSI